MNKRMIPPVIFITALLGLSAVVVHAEEVCETYWDPVNQAWVTVCSGSGGGSSGGGAGGSGGGGGAGGSCTPGTTTVSTVIIGGAGLCEVWEIRHDVCTGQVIFANLVNVIEGGVCTVAGPDPGPEPEDHPCTVLTVSAGGVYCLADWGSNWVVDAGVAFPAAYLDLRPYPATLVGWPGAARNGGTPDARGSGRLDYIPFGGGTEDAPALGDWDNLRLTLTLKPASPVMFFSMQTIGTLALPEIGEAGLPQVVSFERPSHPDAGAHVTAGSIGLGELPQDLPVFSGSAVTAYRLFWRLAYQKYVRDCDSGPDPSSGRLTCKTNRNAATNDGHWRYHWENRGKGGEITPQMVVGLPRSLAADLNGDGSQDAFWNRKVTVRRMDENNRVDNPVWAGSWSWGGQVYWAVREGQGQIAWP